MPSITQAIKSIKDASSSAFNIALGLDSGAATYYDEAAVIDPVSGNLQVVDVRGRASVAASDGVEVSVGGAQYNLAVTTATVVTLTVPAGATHAWIYVDPNSTGRLRITRDGSTTPSAAVGAGMEGGDERIFTNLSNLKLIADGGAVTIHVSYHHY